MGQMLIQSSAFTLLHCMKQLPEVQHYSLCHMYVEYVVLWFRIYCRALPLEDPSLQFAKTAPNLTRKPS